MDPCILSSVVIKMSEEMLAKTLCVRIRTNCLLTKKAKSRPLTPNIHPTHDKRYVIAQILLCDKASNNAIHYNRIFQRHIKVK